MDNLLEEARRLLDVGHVMPAENLCRAALAGDGRRVEAWLLLAAILAAGDRLAAAIDVARNAIANCGPSAALHLELGRLLATAGRTSEGRQHFEVASELAGKELASSPQSFETYSRLGAARLELDDLPQALQLLQRARTLAPEHAPTMKVTAEALLRAGEAIEAEALFRRAFVIEPRLGAEYFDWLIARGRLSEATQQFTQDVLKRNPYDRKLLASYRRLLKAENERTGWFQQALEAKANEDPVDLEATAPVVDNPRGTGQHDGAHVYLVTFASSSDFENSRAALVRNAFECGITHSVPWTFDQLATTRFYERFRWILDQKRGAGYWLWKPYIILHALLAARQDDWVLYHDCGWSAAEHTLDTDIRPMLAWTANYCDGMFPGIFFPQFRQRHWTKRDCFRLMGCDSAHYWNAPTISAKWSLWKKSDISTAFVRKWLALMLDPRLSTDFPNVEGLEDLPGFIDHRHDQAVLSLLVHREGIKCYGSPDHPAFPSRAYWESPIQFASVGNFVRATAQFRPAPPPTNVPLLNIGLWRGTDKADSSHSHLGETFLEIYERYFQGIRSAPVKLLEIGVKEGASLLTWRDYFPAGSIWGLDIDPSCTSYAGDRISVVIGSQDDPETIGRLASAAGAFDVIIDDGSHINALTLRSLELLWPHLKKGGLYILEDLHCTYGAALVTWPGMQFTASSGIDFSNNRKDFEVFLNDAIRRLDAGSGEIRFMHFYSKTLVIGKG